MMHKSYILELADKSGKTIHLSKKQWSHIRKKHPEIESLEILKEGLTKYDKITHHSYDPTVYYYYKFYKYKKAPYKFLCIAVKYLNGTGYIITAYFDIRIK